jgi:hypothetical protein
MEMQTMTHVFSLLEENALRSPRALRLIFFFIFEWRGDFYTFLNNEK